MSWRYLPVCIRLVLERPDVQSQSYLGIYLHNESTQRHFCVLVLHVPLDELDKYKLYVSCKPLMADKEVKWCQGFLGKTAAVFDGEDPLREYLEYAMKNGFNLIPLDTHVGNLLSSVRVSVVHCRAIHEEIGPEHFLDFSVEQVKELSKILIRSLPFNFTGPALFLDFVSTGHVNAVIRDSANLARGYLSDTKYLENMCGALVNLQSGGAVGLLIANLRKLNGDGDLMVIAPWDRLLRLLGLSDLENSTESTRISQNVVTVAPSPVHPVLPLVISQKGHAFSWGSCVKLKNDTLVTNHHVIRPFLRLNAVDCSISLGKDNSLLLESREDVVVPFVDLDLAFIQLSEKNQLALSHIKSAPIGFASEQKIANDVFTVGHGLLLNHQFLDPIVSKGYLCSVTHHNPYKSEYPEIPCMLVASSQCWNGSSGGGLFDLNGRLIGIVSSNAQVFIPSVSGLQYEDFKSEKVPLFCLCIPLELVFECYKSRVDSERKDDTLMLSDEVVRTWNLESSFANVFEREAKL